MGEPGAGVPAEVAGRPPPPGFASRAWWSAALIAVGLLPFPPSAAAALPARAGLDGQAETSGGTGPHYLAEALFRDERDGRLYLGRTFLDARRRSDPSAPAFLPAIGLDE